MAVEKAPAFQFYPKDFLTDGRVAAMTLEECGAYIKLLCLCWTETTLPLDPRRLAQMIGCSPRTFARVWPALRVCFTATEDGLTHGRLDREREKQARYNARQKAKADQRWSGNAAASPGHMPEPSQSHALQSPVSSLQSSEQIHTARVSGFTAMSEKPTDDVGERAARFIEHYAELYPLYRHGARYLAKPALDYQAACDLCRTWPDERLEQLAVIFLRTEHEWAQSGSRTIGQFKALASWADSRLAEVEQEQARKQRLG